MGTSLRRASASAGVIRPPAARDVAERMATAVAADDLENLTRPLLELMEEVTQLDSTYLTRILWDRGEQEIIFSRNSGTITIPEGLRVEWSDTLCRRALESGSPCTDDVPAVWGDSEAAAALGIQTYLSVPVLLPSGEIFGTLCGVSDRRRTVNRDQTRLLMLFSRLVADQVAREQARTAARRRAEDAEEKLRARARFLAIAEHELKSPLTVLLGGSDILARPGLEDRDRVKITSAIKRSAERLRDQVDRMLEEARAEVIARELELIEIDLAAEVSAIVAEFDHVTATHTIEADAAERVPVLADRNALYQSLCHLIENAVKYAPEGTAIRVSVAEEGGAALLRVRDDGPGLPPDVDVFAPFGRGAGDTPGVGLGLHIVRTLVGAMGGSVEGGSDPDGPGAIFTVRLPGKS